MVLNFRFLLANPLLNLVDTVLNGRILLLLLFKLTLPFSFYLLVLLLLDAQLFIQGVDLVLQLLLLLLHLLAMCLESGALIFNYRLCFLNLLHVILHLTFEVIFEETQQVLLNIDFLNLAIDRLQLSVDFGVFHLAKTAKLTAHFNDLIPFLVELVLSALLFNLRDDLGLNQIELKINLVQTPIFFHED